MVSGTPEDHRAYDILRAFLFPGYLPCFLPDLGASTLPAEPISWITIFRMNSRSSSGVNSVMSVYRLASEMKPSSPDT